MVIKWEIEDFIKPTEETLKAEKKALTRKIKGDLLRQQKKELGIEECFWTVGEKPTHIDVSYIEGSEDW